MEIAGWLYIRCPDQGVCERLTFWLDEETRPDFEDEAPQEENSWFVPFEGLDAPEEITHPSKQTLIAEFDWLTDDPCESFEQILGLAGVTKALWYETDGGELSAFYRLEQGRFEPLVSLTPLDDPVQEKRYNCRLSTQRRARLETLADEPEQALLYLAELSEKGDIA